MSVAALDTKVSPVDGSVRHAPNAQDALASRHDFDAAAYPAVAANRLGHSLRRFCFPAIAIAEGVGWTLVNAGAAGHTGAGVKAFARTKDEMSCGAAAGDSVNKLPLNLLASIQAATATDTEPRIET